VRNVRDVRIVKDVELWIMDFGLGMRGLGLGIMDFE